MFAKENQARAANLTLLLKKVLGKIEIGHSVSVSETKETLRCLTDSLTGLARKSRDTYVLSRKRMYGCGPTIHSRDGHDWKEVVCPFCNTFFNVFTQSFAGTGKKCPECGALHRMRQGAIPTKTWVDEQ